MTTTDLILKESRKFGLDDKAITRLAPYSGLRLLSWALKRIVRANDKDETITSQLETVRLLLTEKVPSHVIKYAYYRLPEAKIHKPSEEVIHVLSENFGSRDFWVSVYPCTERGCIRLAVECLLLQGGSPSCISEKLKVAERTVYNLRTKVVRRELDSKSKPNDTQPIGESV